MGVGQWCSEPDVDYFIVVGGFEEAYGSVDLTVMGNRLLFFFFCTLIGRAVIDDAYQALFFITPRNNRLVASINLLAGV